MKQFPDEGMLREHEDIPFPAEGELRQHEDIQFPYENQLPQIHIHIHTGGLHNLPMKRQEEKYSRE